jgi:hypothetical protein
MHRFDEKIREGVAKCLPAQVDTYAQKIVTNVDSIEI